MKRHGKGTIITTAITASLVGAALLLFAGCKNFMSGDDDLKEILKDEVTKANAQTVEITVRAENDNVGVTSPLGKTSVKVGIPFNIATTVNANYAFSHWTFLGGEEGEVVFDDPQSTETRATLTTNNNEIIIRPIFDRRPYVVTWSPFSGSKDNLINKETVITFNEEINPATAILGPEGTVQITTVKTLRIATDPKVNVESDFNISISGKALTLSLKSGRLHEINSTITVSLSYEITDLAGNTMADDFSWFFETGNGKDDTPPDITGFTINPEQYLGTGNLTLDVSAEDTQQEVVAMEVTATPWSSGSSAGTSAGSDVIIYNSDYLDSVAVSLSGVPEGWVKISVRVADNSNNWTDPDPDDPLKTKYILLDSQAPSQPIVTVSPTSPTNSTVSFTVSSTDPGSVPSGIKEYRITGGATTTPTSTTGAFSGITPALQGNNNITVVAVDNAGNISTPPRTVSVFYDSIAPTVSVGTISTSGNPGWARNGQTIQIPFSITETGSGLSAGPSVTIGGRTATVTGTYPNYTAAYTIPIDEETLTQGYLNYVITATDNAGNNLTSPSTTTGIQYDRTPPGISITGPSPASVKSGTYADYTITYTGASAVTLAPGDVTVSTVSGTPEVAVPQVTGSGTATRTVRVTGSGNGVVRISIADGTATDQAGNQAAAAGPSNNATIDNTAPSIVVGPITPASGFIKNNETIQIAMTVTEALSGLASGSPAVTIGGRPATVTGTLPNLTASYTIPAGESTLTEGELQYTINASDNANNIMTEISASTEVVYDRTPPVIDGTPSINTTGNPGWVKNGESIEITFTVNESGGSGLATGYPSATIGGQTADIDATNAPVYVASYEFSGTTVDPGLIYYTISLQDKAGNSGGVSSTSTGITYDRTPPGISITGPSPASVKSGTYADYTITYTGASAVTLAPGDVTVSTVSGTPEVAVPQVTGSGTATRTVRVTGSGNGVVRISIADGTATDQAGNQAAAAGPSNNATIDNTAPSIVVGPITPASGFIKNNETIQIAMTVTEALSGLASGSPAVTIGGRPATVTGTLPNLTASYTIPAGESTLTEGELQYTINASDNANNIMTEISASTEVVYDRTPPVIDGTPSINTTGNPGWVKNGESIEITFTVNESGGSGLATGYPSATIGGQTADIDATNAPVYVASYEFSGTTVDPGLIYYTISLQDKAGNSGGVSSTSTGITYDRTPPGISITGPSPESVKNGTYADYTITYTGASSVTLYWEDVTVETVSGTPEAVDPVVTGSGTATRTVRVTGIGDGVVRINIAAGTATDEAGNSALAAGPSENNIIDNTDPTFTTDPADATFIPGTRNLTVEMSDDISGFSALQFLEKGVTDWATPSNIKTAGSFSAVRASVEPYDYTVSGVITGMTLADTEFFEYRLVDGAGNFSAVKRITRSGTTYPSNSIALPKGGSTVTQRPAGGNSAQTGGSSSSGTAQTAASSGASAGTSHGSSAGNLAGRYSSAPINYTLPTGTNLPASQRAADTAENRTGTAGIVQGITGRASTDASTREADGAAAPSAANNTPVAGTEGSRLATLPRATEKSQTGQEVSSAEGTGKDSPEPVPANGEDPAVSAAPAGSVKPQSGQMEGPAQASAARTNRGLTRGDVIIILLAVAMLAGSAVILIKRRRRKA